MQNLLTTQKVVGVYRAQHAPYDPAVDNLPSGSYVVIADPFRLVHVHDGQIVYISMAGFRPVAEVIAAVDQADWVLRPANQPTTPTAGTTATAATTQAVAPSRVMSWLDNEGRLEMPVFDDRQVSDEVRAAYPWPNPRWAPFNRCLQAGGYGIEGPIITRRRPRSRSFPSTPRAHSRHALPTAGWSLLSPRA